MNTQSLSSWLFLATLLFLGQLQAQTKINNQFEFRDGIYTHYQDFQKNKPSHPLSSLTKLDYELDAEKNILILSPATQLEVEALSENTPWGICIEGVSYICASEHREGSYYFVRLHVVGKLCYYYYNAFRDKLVTMYVHNPYTGEQIGQRNITNKELVSVQRMLFFKTANRTDFTKENLLNWTKDDIGLQKSIQEIEEKATEKLFKPLLIYNDRHPIYLN